jgi:hypothetical protein
MPGRDLHLTVGEGFGLNSVAMHEKPAPMRDNLV